MNFTYEAYAGLIEELRRNGYVFADYHNYDEFERCVILRHDIDTSINDALKLARLERELGVTSTYFVLLRTDAYNPASMESTAAIREIQGMGHEIGLHFDEKAYDITPFDAVAWAGNITDEARILSAIIGSPVTTASMHRPSREMLDADLKIPGIVNSYGSIFFKGFKYLSDSRRRWREPALEIIRSNQYDKLQILTHAFWYKDVEESIEVTVRRYVQSANAERYCHLADNITDLGSILTEDSI